MPKFMSSLGRIALGVWVVSVAAALAVMVVRAQTQAPLAQIRPTTGPATAIVVTLGTKAVWADLGPGLAVDLLPTGRAMIRAVPVGTHTHVHNAAPMLVYEDPRTCFTLPPGALNPVVYLNGLRESVTDDYAEVSPGKFCFVPYYGNLLLATADTGQQLVRVDYLTTP